MKILRKIQLSLLTVLSVLVAACTPTAQQPVVTPQKSAINTTLPLSLLPFTGEKQLVLGDLDELQRSTMAHIQLRFQDKPSQQREPKINVNPVGWHNYKFPINSDGKEAWLMNRGHLVGYQFSGLNDEVKNLTPMTAYLNTGSLSGTDETNPAGMLFYEEKLARWLKERPNQWLDYQVKPLYQGDELIPRQIELQYAGIDETGELVAIQFQTAYEQVQLDGTTQVILPNESSNAVIDYRSGMAQAKPLASTSGEQTLQTENSQASRTVYVANRGKSSVYWYDRLKMPDKTNQSQVVEMTEAAAIAQGKIHSTREE